MKRAPQLPLIGEPGFAEGVEGRVREQEATRKKVEDEFRAILDKASSLGKGDKWAILQIIRKLEWRAPKR